MNNLSMNTINSYIAEMKPRVEQLVKEGHDEQGLLKFICSHSVVGALPVPHPIAIRTYRPRLLAIQKLHSFLWGLVLLKVMEMKMINTKDVTLISVHTENEDEQD